MILISNHETIVIKLDTQEIYSHSDSMQLRTQCLKLEDKVSWHTHEKEYMMFENTHEYLPRLVITKISRMLFFFKVCENNLIVSHSDNSFRICQVRADV